MRAEKGQEPIPPVLCMTATAKPDVVADITRHFQDELGIALRTHRPSAQGDGAVYWTEGQTARNHQDRALRE